MTPPRPIMFKKIIIGILIALYGTVAIVIIYQTTEMYWDRELSFNPTKGEK